MKKVYFSILMILSLSVHAQFFEIIADINQGTESSRLSEDNVVIQLSDLLLFAANDGVHGYELWSYDGSETKLVKDINQGASSSECQNFHLLEDNKRIAMLDSVAKQYAIVYDHLKHTQVATVTTAVPLTKEVEQQVLDRIVSLTGDKANLENKINPAILGGFILRVGDVQYDASISNYLNELKKEFDNSHFIPKI